MKQFLWTIPFILFLFSYYTISRIFHIPTVQTPHIVGKTIQQAVIELSNLSLHLYILAEKEDADLPEGTIISQTPKVDSMIKTHQSVYCVISKKTPSITAPFFINQDKEIVKKNAEKLNIKIKLYPVASTAPTNSCIAQFPEAGHTINNQAMIIYIAADSKKPFICPNFIGKQLTEITDLFEKNNLIYKVTGNNASINSNPITEQRPLPGSLIMPTEPINLYVR